MSHSDLCQEDVVSKIRFSKSILRRMTKNPIFCNRAADPIVYASVVNQS